MALSRRTGQRFQASIWPGFVDAMTALLLVLMFVLTIFMIVQFMLRETITGQETELDELSAEVVALSQALGLERDLTRGLEADVGRLESNLGSAEARLAALSAQLEDRTAELAQAETQISGFEAQVAGLLAAQAEDRSQIADLETTQAELLSTQEALNLALAQARGEIDDAAEAARLAAARREALQALIADLETQNAGLEQQSLAQQAKLDENATALTEAEARRAADLAAAEALRARLEGAEDELTAMTLALEAKRKEAEDTLTLLAAAQAAQEDLDIRLAAALLERDTLAGTLDATGATLEEQQAARAAQAAALAELEERLAGLDAQNAALLEEKAAQAAALLTLEDRLAGLDAEQAALLEEKAAQAAALANLEAQTAELDQQAQAALSKNQELSAELAAALAERDAQTGDRNEVAAQLAAALAAKLAAERVNEATLSEAEKQSALLAQANRELADVEARSAEDQRKLALLNEQVAALRGQLGTLQSLLDAAAEADADADIQLQALGNQLNTALARAAAEERRRRQLEEAERKRLEAEAQDLQKYRSEFFGQLRDVLGAQEGVRIVGDRFVFSSEVLFPPGGATLSDEGRGEIAKIASILRQVADDIPEGIDWVIRVDGHTDNVPLSGTGEFADNWELSQARALSVVKYMANFLGIPPTRLSANGFGQYQPINLADTPEARAQNRRIELKFTEK